MSDFRILIFDRN